MQNGPRSGGWLIIASFIVALILEMLPLPRDVNALAPAWLIMTLVFWCLIAPHRVGVGIGWAVGLLFDVAQGTLLGLHAGTFALTAYIVLRLHQRVRVFPVWQQAVLIAALVLLNQLLVVWVKGITGQPALHWGYLAQGVSSALVWPLYCFLLDEARIRNGVK